ncbi:MAG: hypothetical protein QW587_04685 [Candidatus Bathyarchaeia archaeon]
MSSGKSIETIVVEATKKKTPLQEAMEERMARQKAELEALQMERLLAEEKAKIAEAQKTEVKASAEASGAAGPSVDLRAGFNYLVQTNPEAAKKFLESLSPEDIEKLNLIAAGGGPGAASAQYFTQLAGLMKGQGMTAKDVVEIVRLMQGPEGGMKTTLDIPALIKAVAELRPEPRQDTTYEMVVKPLIDEVKALRESMVQTQFQILQKEISELKQRPSVLEEIQSKAEEVKALRDVFGGAQQPTGLSDEAQIKLKEMELNYQRDMMKQQWEMTKMQLEHGLERKKWDGIIKGVAAPLLEKMEPVINAAAKTATMRVEAMSQPTVGSTAQPSSSPEQTQYVVICPKEMGGCGGQIPVTLPIPDTVTCPHCQKTWTKASSQ